MVCELPLFDGEGSVESFFMKFEGLVMEPRRLLALDVALRDTPARWWTMHKISINNWGQCRIFMTVRFGEVSGNITEHYSGMTDPR